MLTVPNALSLVRLAGVPLFMWLLLGPHSDLWALGVLMLAGVTDWLDGWTARRLDQRSALGEILDPVADRLYIVAVVVAFALRDIVPWWVAVIVLARDFFWWALVPFLRRKGFSSLPGHFLGKCATFNLLYAFPFLLLGEVDGVAGTLGNVFGWALVWWGIALYWWVGLIYTWQVRKLVADPDRRAPLPDA